MILPRLPFLLLCSLFVSLLDLLTLSILSSAFLHSLLNESPWLLLIFGFTKFIVLLSFCVQVSDFLSPSSNIHSKAKINFDHPLLLQPGLNTVHVKLSPPKFVAFSLFLSSKYYNPGHNILELYNILVQVQFPTSKTKLDIQYSKTWYTKCLTSCRTT